MVQAALAAAAPVAAGLAGAVGGGIKAIGSQTRRSARTAETRQDTSTAMVAASRDPKVARIAADNASQERWLYFLTQPEIIGLAVLIAGLYASNRITFSKYNQAQNELMQSLAMAGSVLISLGYAGVGDLTTAGLAATAGTANLMAGISWPSLLPDLGQTWDTFAAIAAAPANSLAGILKLFGINP